MKNFALISFPILCTLLFYSMLCFSQRNVTIATLKQELIKQFPPKPFRLKEQNQGYNNSYVYDKITKNLFMCVSLSLKRDSSFRFIYVNNQIKYCEFILWSYPNNKRGKLYRFYYDEAIVYPSTKNPKDIDDFKFLIEKGTALQKSAQTFLQSNKPS